jgi:hypothetical protein
VGVEIATIFGPSEVPETMLHFDAEIGERQVRGIRMSSATNGSIAKRKSQWRLMVAAIPRLLRRQEVLGEVIGGLIFRNRLRQTIQRISPELDAINIGAQAVNRLPQSLLGQFTCRHDVLRPIQFLARTWC